MLMQLTLSMPSDRLDPPQFAPELCWENCGSCWGVWQAGLSWGDREGGLTGGVWQAGLSWGDREGGLTGGVWQAGLSWGDREGGLTRGVWQAGLLHGVRKVCRVEALPVLSQDVNLLATSDRLTSPLLLHMEEEEQSDLNSYTTTVTHTIPVVLSQLGLLFWAWSVPCT